ncbi:MAG: 6-carboxytetrahydropterin synthase QueD [Lentisphaerae bacterium]|nr:6-carboxytetrahydropterin synthase QueD [Lentisphaerota bacterium]
MLTVRKTCHFHAAHILDGHAGECCNLHGHTYRVTVEVAQRNDEKGDMVIDFHDLKKLLAEFVEAPFDHAFIYDSTSSSESEIAGFLQQRKMKTASLPYRSTAENMARYIFQLLRKEINVIAVRVHESDDSSAEYRYQGE